jgi:ribose/xylose/arabinose/galactoside ABC-type transport system permease subunit
MAIAGQVGALLVFNGHGALTASLAAVLVATVCGVFNGVLVARYAIQPIIATLILFIAGRGIAQLITGGKLQAIDNEGFQWLGLGRIADEIPAQVAVMVVVALVVGLVVRSTLFGRYLIAVGGNETASRLAGVPVARTKVTAYAVSGLLAGVVGLIVVGNTSASDANHTGVGMELDAIAAVAVAGTSLNGGRISATATVIGAVMLKLLQNTLVAHGIPKEVAQMIEGAVIIGALYLQRAAK